MRVRSQRHGVDLDVRYYDNGRVFLGQFDVDDLLRGAAAEKIADQQMRARIARHADDGKQIDEYVLEGADGSTVFDPGPDLVWRDPRTGELVVHEVKFLSDDGNFGVGQMGRTGPDNNIVQMDDDWIRNVIEEGRGIDSSTRTAMDEALESGNLRKDVEVLQNRQADGRTITRSLSDAVGPDRVRLHKIGKQR